MAGLFGSPAKKIKMFSWRSKQCLVGIQALVSQSVYIIFGCEINGCDILGCKGHIFWQVVIIFILFSVFKNWNEVSHGESRPGIKPVKYHFQMPWFIHSPDNSHHTFISAIRSQITKSSPRTSDTNTTPYFVTFFFLFIEVQLIYNAVLVSGIQ